jgi:hypothetical protein
MSNILLMGMVYSMNNHIDRGQEYRDYQRCVEMEKEGHNVKTLDLHREVVVKKRKRGVKGRETVELVNHITGNFNDPRRMFKSIQQKWGLEFRFQKVFLDYFFSPVGLHSLPHYLFLLLY